MALLKLRAINNNINNIIITEFLRNEPIIMDLKVIGKPLMASYMVLPTAAAARNGFQQKIPVSTVAGEFREIH